MQKFWISHQSHGSITSQPFVPTPKVLGLSTLLSCNKCQENCLYGCASLSPGSEGPPVVICEVGVGFWGLFGFVVVGFLLTMKLYFSTLSIPQSGEKNHPYHTLPWRRYLSFYRYLSSSIYKNEELAVLLSSSPHFACLHTSVGKPESTISNSHLIPTRIHSILFSHPKKGGGGKNGTSHSFGLKLFKLGGRLLFCFTYMQDVINHNVFFIKPRTLTCSYAFPIFHAQYSCSTFI